MNVIILAVVTGFIVWYGFIRAVIPSGLAETNIDRWLRISRTSL